MPWPFQSAGFRRRFDQVLAGDFCSGKGRIGGYSGIEDGDGHAGAPA